MKSDQGSDGVVVMQVRQVERALREVYINAGLLDVGDLEGKPDEERDPRLLSRALAAQAVRIVTGFSPSEAAATVIDGVNDQGIDALAVVDGTDPHVYLVQAKWSRKGKASSDRSAVMELLSGLRLIDEEDFGAFNPRGQQLAELSKAVMEKGPVSVTQVIVLMRADEVTDGFQQAIIQGERDFNRHGDVLDHRIILSAEVWNSVRRDLMPRPVTLEAELFPWFSISSPYESFQGVVGAEQVVAWADHGSNLFNLNIRNPLGRTPINNELIETLTGEPANFWYFNNGITILCESIERSRQSLHAPQGRPITLTLHNASVANGAQTVRSVAEAVSKSEDAACAQVSVRIIVTGSADEFSKRATHATNRQNRVESRDFVALDPIQAAIIEDMRAELGLEYSVRRTELEPNPATGCSVVEAACALACVHSDAQYAARISAKTEALWERGAQGVYENLFRPRPGPYLLWNAVQVFRAVRKNLHALRPQYQGRGAALVDHGVHLISYLVFRSLDTEAIGEPDSRLEWQQYARERVPELVGKLIPAVAGMIDSLYSNRSQIRAACSDISRCREIANHVLGQDDLDDLVVQDKYQRSAAERKRRRPNAVSVIIDRGLLEEGAQLTLVSGTSTEYKALTGWLSEDRQRELATWVPHRSKPLLWAADGLQYSPTGLIFRMWDLAGWEGRPVAVQGTARWATRTGETLADLAWRTLDELESGEFD
ncbi:AIPR family protein [Saccharomonospora halophila]|uniref:AIPR family protein n=1 Tax=Saccharomonospora halophila TaxID=129922 RepID=UPI0009FCBBB1|nr:AIPR family protein [Saccharomonospora halophila]